MATPTAAQVITEALRLYAIIDQTEQAQPADIANGVSILNNLLRNEHCDGAAQYLIKRVTAVIPQAVSGQLASFSIGTASPSYLVQLDAVGMKSLWCNDINLTVNRETRQAPSADVVRTTYPGIITKWHTERQVDGSILVSVWQPPRAATPVLIEYGGRIAALTDPLGGDPVALPPEGIHDIEMLYGRRVMSSYGKSAAQVGVVLTDAEAVDKRWKQWANGQQWLRFVRS